LRPPAQGCEERATLGNAAEDIGNPKGVAPVIVVLRNPDAPTAPNACVTMSCRRRHVAASDPLYPTMLCALLRSRLPFLPHPSNTPPLLHSTCTGVTFSLLPCPLASERMMNKPFKWAAGLLAVILVLALIFFSNLLSGHSEQSRWRLPTGKGTPAVAIGDNHGVILASDGSLWTWGETGFGWQVLGLGSNVRTQACLRRIGLETNWVNVAVGGSSTLALKSDGTIWAWGENIYSQLGDGTTAREQASPVRSVPGDDWK
jgi:Regulator of chromosome condensation (RCC1) repeat